MTDKQFRLLHTNDTHSYVDLMARRLHLFQTIRKQDDNVLTLDSGDNLMGSLFYNIFHGKYEPLYLNRLEYDAITIGNHEFDGGSNVLAQFLNTLNIPVIQSNLDVQADTVLREFPFHHTLIKQLPNGLKIGLFALLTPTTQMSSSPSDETIFKDPLKVAQECVDYLTHEKVDCIVLLSHLGDTDDILLAQEISGIDVIVGAHTHKLLEEPIVVLHQFTEHETLILQAGSYGQYVGDLVLTLSDNHHKIWQYNIHDLQQYAGVDKALDNDIQGLLQSVEHIINRPIAESAEPLIGNREITRVQSTNLTNLVTDAYYHKAIALGFKPDIAIMNSGGIRRDIPKGDITYGQVVQVLPFICSLFICNMTGEELYQSLSKGAFPLVSHAKLEIDSDYHVSVWIETQQQWEKLDRCKTYTVVTNSFIGSGKGNYVGFIDKENLVAETIYDTDVVIEYLSQLDKPFTYDNTPRILRI